MLTKKESLSLLCKSILNRLENQKAISFPARLRQIIQDEIASLIRPLVLTDEDLRDRTLAKVGAKQEMLQDAGFTDGEPYRAAKALTQSQFGGEALSGFYFQKAPKFVANSIAQYFMRSSHIDDVFEVDEDLEKQIIEVVKHFKATEVR